MSELLRTQRALQNYLLDSQAPLDAITPGSGLKIDSLIVETERVSRAVRLNIYANAYRARITEALSVDFSGLHAYLGDDAFSELTNAYIERYPSRYFSLRYVGAELANFLKNASPYNEHIELYELALFEWALCHAFDAAGATCADAAYFSALPPQQWPEMTLRFISSLQMVSMRSNTPAMWKSLSAEQAPPAIEIAEKEQPWLIWRSGLKIMFRPLDVVEKTALDVFMNGETFADACGKLAQTLPESEVPQRAVAMLQQWIADRLIVAP